MFVAFAMTSVKFARCSIISPKLLMIFSIAGVFLVKTPKPALPISLTEAAESLTLLIKNPN